MNFLFAKLFSRPPVGASLPMRVVAAALVASWAVAVTVPAQAQTPASSPADVSSPQPVPADEIDPTDQTDQKNLPKIALTREIVFQVLAAEIALQRGEIVSAYQTYLALARSTHDPRTAQRATEIALRAQSPVDALVATQLWHQYAPDDERASQLDASLLVLSGKLDDAKPLLAAQLSKVPAAERGSAMLALQSLISRGPDRIGGLHVLQELLRNDLGTPQAQLAIARQQINADDQPGARKSLETALQIKPDYQPAVLLLGQFGPEERKEAIGITSKVLAKNPQDRKTRLSLAQLYLADNQLDAAGKEFETLRSQDPSDLTPLMALALIQIQEKNYDQAKTYLQQFATTADQQPAGSHADAGQAYMYLAQIAIEQKDEAGADQWLNKVAPTSNQYLAAQITRVQLRAKQGKIDEARLILSRLKSPDPRDQALIARTDAGLLAAAKRYPEAEARLADASRAYPDDPDVIYDYAMLAEKTHHYTLMETQLRRLMALQPDNPQAYNALGYSLADRNQRLDEASKLIERASQLAPTDAFIMDSLGWVKFRSGDKENAAKILQKAYQLQPNAEIGAHLGEVLWNLGQRDQARQSWRAARALDPDNDTLVHTLKRFQINDL